MHNMNVYYEERSFFKRQLAKRNLNQSPVWNKWQTKWQNDKRVVTIIYWVLYTQHITNTFLFFTS